MTIPCMCCRGMGIVTLDAPVVVYRRNAQGEIEEKTKPGEKCPFCHGTGEMELVPVDEPMN